MSNDRTRIQSADAETNSTAVAADESGGPQPQYAQLPSQLRKCSAPQANPAFHGHGIISRMREQY